MLNLRESEIIRIAWAGKYVFALVLITGLATYAHVIRHEFQMASKVEYDTIVIVRIGQKGKNNLIIDSYALRVALSYKLDRATELKPLQKNLVKIRSPRPPDDLVSDVRAVIDKYNSEAERTKQVFEAEISALRSKIKNLRSSLNETTSQTGDSTTGHNAMAQQIAALEETLTRLVIELGTEVYPIEVMSVADQRSGGAGRSKWRIISAVIGSLAIIYFAGLTGLAFGYVREQRLKGRHETIS